MSKSQIDGHRCPSHAAPLMGPTLQRRSLLQATACTLLSLPLLTRSATAAPRHLVIDSASVPLVLDHGPPTEVWAFNQKVPGPILRFRQGERAVIDVENRLQEPTTVHWHGLRVPAAMDGVPYLSQAPIQPGETFRYDLPLLDTGTFWYHPHFNSAEQVGRGLHGALIVDELDPPEVDRDVIWVMDDWRLNGQAQPLPFAQNMHDASHAGRIGNTITVNGSIDEVFAVRPGERLRLRLINVANARTFSPNLQNLRHWLISLDGHPVMPAPATDGRIMLGAGQRADVIVDCQGEPGDVIAIEDDAYGPDFAYVLMRLAFGDEPAPRSGSLDTPTPIAANPIGRPDLEPSERHEITFEGGAMGGMAGATLDGRYLTMRELAQAGKLWALNGRAHNDVREDDPLLSLKLGQSYVIALQNRTAFDHPIHLHGHSFHIIARNGAVQPEPHVRDTVLLRPDEQVEIAFVADNPGSWMFHCHVLEHQAAGMMAVIEVA